MKNKFKKVMFGALASAMIILSVTVLIHRMTTSALDILSNTRNMRTILS